MSSKTAPSADAASSPTKDALLAAAAILAYGIVSAVVSFAAGAIGQVGYGQDDVGYLGSLALGNLQQVFVWQLPAAIGVFLSFRFIAPIRPNLSWARVAGRGAVATVVSVALAVLVTALVSAMTAFTGSIFSDLTRGFDPRSLVGILIEALRSGLPGVVAMLPVVLLAAFALWYGRSRRAGTPPV